MELFILVFLAVTLGSLGLFHFLPYLSPGVKSNIRKRFKEEFQAKRPGRDAPKTLFKDLDILTLSSAEEYAMLGTGGNPPRRLSPLGLRNGLNYVLQEAGFSQRPWRFLLLAGVFALVPGLAGAWLWWWPGGLIGCSVGVALPFGLLQVKRKARRDKLVNQLPKAFDLMARVMRAGQSVPQAFQAVGDAFDEPLGGEFARCQQQQNLGLSPDVVFQEMAKRSGVLEFRIFVMAMLIQRQAGGNLSEVLERLAALIRGRLRLRRHVRTLTAEGRLQGLALLVLPFVMYAAMFVINRPYAEELLNHPALLWGTAVLMGIGVLWIRKIVNYEG
ncbi:MAG TPA: pilus assembly protein TadB [Planctomycetales bacterium]|jgi:tight adherence protein B|nr:pilus assembly protein TadB [Planctomycetales bacterium]